MKINNKMKNNFKSKFKTKEMILNINFKKNMNIKKLLFL